MKNLIAYFSGIVFALGLVVAGMTNPNVVIGFLDVFGDWNPQLAFVMGGAVSVNLVFFNLILKKDRPKLAPKFSLPERSDLDRGLVLGSAMFGVGWGILGVCPGPGLVNLVTFEPLFLIFGASMLAGMGIHHFVFKRK